MKIKGSLFVFILFLFVCMFQGCIIYHRQTSTLQESIEANQRVKVIFNDCRKFHFHRLESDGEKVYGVKKVKGEEPRIVLYKNEIQENHLKAKGASTGLSVLLGLGIFTGIIIEQDHRFIKWTISNGLGYKSFKSASVTLSGIETVRMIKKIS